MNAPSLLLTALLIGCSVLMPSLVGADEPMHADDDIATVRSNLEDGKAVLLDVRELKEWNDGHLSAARLVPLSAIRKASEQGEDKVEGIEKGTILYLHCGSGRRVLSAASLMADWGYDVRPLKWGYAALLDQGFEAAK